MEHNKYKKRREGQSCRTCRRPVPHPRPDRTNGKPLLCPYLHNRSVAAGFWCVGYEPKRSTKDAK